MTEYMTLVMMAGIFTASIIAIVCVACTIKLIRSIFNSNKEK